MWYALYSCSFVQVKQHKKSKVCDIDVCNMKLLFVDQCDVTRSENIPLKVTSTNQNVPA